MNRSIMEFLHGLPDFLQTKIDKIIPISNSNLKPEGKKQDSKTQGFSCGNRKIGDGNFILMAGPCAVEDNDTLDRTASEIHRSGATFLRGGAFKPRTSPYDFQGLGKPALLQLREVADRYKMQVVTEIVDAKQLDLIMEYADILQVGSRNASNFSLLKELGQCNKPILLKRGMSSTIQEFLLAAEYILSGGNQRVILCERGIRTFESATRNTLDLAAVPLLKAMSNLPVLVDPSHGTGRRDLVIPMSLAAAVAGADGLLIEVHIEPDKAISDGSQSLSTEQFKELTEKLFPILSCNERTITL
jgi:3-deoxy-7-phosphoheptulonate synthase